MEQMDRRPKGDVFLELLIDYRHIVPDCDGDVETITGLFESYKVAPPGIAVRPKCEKCGYVEVLTWSTLGG